MRTLLAITMILTLVTQAGAQSGTHDDLLRIGDKVHHVAITTLQSKTLDPSNPGGSGMIVVFIRKSHKPSEQVLKTIAQALRRSHPQEDPQVVAISSTKMTPSEVSQMKKNGLPKIVFADDTDRKIYGAFQVVVTPTIFAIDSKGTLVGRYAYLPPGLLASLELDIALLSKKIDAKEHRRRRAEHSHGAHPANPRAGAAETLARRMFKKRQYLQILRLNATSNGSHRSSNMDAICLLSALALEKKDIVNAIAGRLLNEDKLSSLGHFALARRCAAIENRNGSLSHLNAAIKISPGDAVLLAERGRIYCLSGDFERATKDLLAALRRLSNQELPR